MKRAAWIFSIALLAATRTAFAEDEAPAPPPEAPPAPAPTTTRTDLWKIGVGPRFNYVSSAGYDAFSKNNLLPQWSLEGQYPLLHRGRFALGVGVGYSGGGSAATMRGDKTGLAVHTLQVPIEGRYHVGRGAYAFARVAPGTTALLGSIEEASAPNEIKDTKWVFSTDLSAGAAILLGPRGYDQADKRTIRFWAVPELGYTLATTARLDLRPDRDAREALGTDERTTLPGLNLSAFYWRLSLATTF